MASRCLPNFYSVVCKGTVWLEGKDLILIMLPFWIFTLYCGLQGRKHRLRLVQVYHLSHVFWILILSWIEMDLRRRKRLEVYS